MIRVLRDEWTPALPRWLAQVESGQANLSFAMLYKISRALDVNLLDLIDLDRHGPEDAELHALINRMDSDQKHKLLAHVQTIVGTARRETAHRFALLGMRGAGKSTLGRAAAEQLNLPFIRISDRIAELAPCLGAGATGTAHEPCHAAGRHASL